MCSFFTLSDDIVAEQQGTTDIHKPSYVSQIPSHDLQRRPFRGKFLLMVSCGRGEAVSETVPEVNGAGKQGEV
jgi:hypothetical protein